VSPASEQIRVSVLGGRTQLDIALPVDLPAADFIPELAQLVLSRAAKDDDAATNDERRTFWVLSRFDTGTPLPEDQTLREAGVVNGELLRLSSRRALSPPTLYDDVVDAAARLNRAAYATWDAASARWMAFAGIVAAATVLTCFVIDGVFTADRAAITGVAGFVVATLVGAAAVAHRAYGLSDVAAVMGWAAIPITGGVLWAALGVYGNYGIAAGCGVLPLLCAVYYRVIATGHWAYIAASVLASFAGVTMLGRALGLRADVACVGSAVTAALLCLAVPRLTATLGRLATPTARADAEREEWAFENPFVPPVATTAHGEAGSGAGMPTAEAVWAAVRSATLTRSAIVAGLALDVAVSAAVLVHHAVGVGAPVFVFALTCAAVLGLRSRMGTGFERAALAVPAIALVVITCALAQDGPAPIPVVAFGVLVAIAVAATACGLVSRAGRSGWLATLLCYLEYAAVASLLPLALWVSSIYDRLGLW
jgi:type VII secretion integral membrane protein EccD